MAQGDHTSTGRLADRVADDLRARIAAGEYKPGDKLPSLREIAASRGYGKNTVVAAFELLVAFLQAYVFAILTCVYLNDAIHPGH